MEKKKIALTGLFALAVFGAAQGEADWAQLNAAAREQAKVPLRVGVPGVIPFWNAHSKAFIHPPAFDFKEVDDAKEYCFTLGDQKWVAAKPWLPVPADIWDSLAPGYYTLKIDGVGERKFYRAAVFHGPYPPAVRDYREAARRVYAAVFNMPQVQGWKTSDDPPKGYDLYCYPAKILSSMIRALCRHAKAEPKDADQAFAIARKMADWLIAHSQPEGAPLAHFPPTYWGDRRDVAVRYAGQNMLGYPAHAANAYFDLYEAGRAACPQAADAPYQKYRNAAVAIMRTYLKLQGADGTWPLKVLEKDGSPVRANRLVPYRYVLGALDRAFAATGDVAFMKARERAFAYVLDGPAKTWNWDGQFEDMDPMPPYRNLQKGVAVDAAIRLFALGRNAEAIEMVDWCEDQFVVWSDPIHNMDWKNWKTPTALEQYDYYTPIDASMGDMIGVFAAAYKATGNRLYLEKAKALADNITRHQRTDGTIPTYFDNRGGSDWVNCMVYVADRLEFLAAALPSVATASGNMCSPESTTVPFAIVAPDAPKPYEVTAAKELRTYLGKCVPSGKVTVGGAKDVVFHVGDTALARAKGLAAEQIDEDRWIIRSFGKDIVLVGGGSRGTLYAVSHFLEDFCDVRWWSDREEDVPVRDSLALSALDASGKPAFLYRSIHRSHSRAESDPRLAIRRRLNSNGLVSIPAEWGGGMEYGPPDHAHTFDMYLPWSKYGKEHPEWYSLIGGRRIGGQSDGQLCLSNPDLKAEFLGKLREMIAKGDADARAKGLVPPRLYEISMNDNGKACECEACKAEYEKWNKSGQYVRFVNALAAEIGKERPEIFLTTLAYIYTEEPPKGDVRAADNVIVKLCDTKSNAAASILEPGNDVFKKLLAGWQGKFAHLFVWDYAITFDKRTLGFPFASEFHYADTYRHYLANGASGIFWEHEYPLVSDLWEIKFYIESRFFEDPYLDETTLIRDAFQRYFGPAVKPVFAVRRKLENVRVRTKAVVGWANEFTFISDDDLAEMSALWDEAERLAKGDAMYLRRVKNARLGTDRLAEYRRNMPVRRADGVYVADVSHLDLTYVKSHRGAIVDDPESPIGGKAVAFNTEPNAHGYLSLPFAFGVYNTGTKKTTGSREFKTIDTSPGYHWYTLENTTIPDNAMLYFTRAWQLQAPFGYAAFAGKKFDIRVAAKFEGPEYIPGSTATNRIFIAGYELVPR